MKKSELLARIDALERRLAVLEARPVVYPAPVFTPPVLPNFYPNSPISWPGITTCIHGQN